MLRVDETALLPDRWTDTYDDPAAMPGLDDVYGIARQYAVDPSVLPAQDPPWVVDGTVRYVTHQQVPGVGTRRGGAYHVERAVVAADAADGLEVETRMSEDSRALLGAALVADVLERYPVDERDVAVLLD